MRVFYPTRRPNISPIRENRNSRPLAMPPTAMHTGAHVPILNALLKELARTWREAPELAERCDVDNMRFFLEGAPLFV